MEILPTTTVTTITTGMLDVVTDNIGAILGVLAFGMGVTFVTRWFRKSTNKAK